MKKLMNEHGWYKGQFFGGAPSMPSTPSAPKVPPPPAPPPTATDEDVNQQERETLERKKFQKGRDKTLLAQTSGTEQKKTLLGG